MGKCANCPKYKKGPIWALGKDGRLYEKLPLANTDSRNPRTIKDGFCYANIWKDEPMAVWETDSCPYSTEETR